VNRPPSAAVPESAEYLDDLPETLTDLELARLSEWHVPTPALRELVQAVETQRCVAVVGEPGAGKSATLAALARPELTKGAVPPDFLHAILLLNASSTLDEIATLLADQMLLNVSEFAEAQYQFCVRTTYEQRSGLDPLFVEVVGPLRFLPQDPVRIAIDGSDPMSPEIEAPLREFYNLVGTHPDLAFVRLIVTARPTAELPSGAHRLELPQPDEKFLRRFCSKRGLPASVATQVAAAAGGAWLCAKLAGELAARDPKIMEQWRAAASAVEVCHSALAIQAELDPQRWQSVWSPVLAVLAAAGAGPLAPMPLLGAALAALEHPMTPDELQVALEELAPFITRAQVEGEPERVGVCHSALAEALLEPAETAPLGVEPAVVHRSILAAIDTLAPMDQFDPADVDALQRYARAREAQHCWSAGEAGEIAVRFANRYWPSARQSLICLEAWLPRIKESLGATAPATFAMRDLLAHWTSEAGDAQEALSLYQELLADQQSALGPADPQVLNTRAHVALCMGEGGDAEAARGLFESLLADAVTAWGADDPRTLSIRGQVANWTGESGDGSQAIALLQKLFADLVRVLGPDHAETLQTRNSLVLWKGSAGFKSEAMRLSRSLLPDYERLFGKDHPAALLARDNLIFWTGEKGDAQNALRMAQELLSDYQRQLGPDHPDTLTLRSKIAFWTGGAGDARAALRSFEHLLPDLDRALGKMHPDTLAARNCIVFWMGVTGDAAGALALAQELIPDCRRLLGAGHATTLSLERLVENLEQLQRINGRKSTA